MGDPDREPLGIPLLDTWIARADALRKLMEGTASSYGPIPLNDEQIIAGAEEIYRAVRHRCVYLIRAMPPGQENAAIALARIADAVVPTPELLTSAIENLIVSAPTWSTESREFVSAALDASARPYPVARDLQEAANISSKIFRTIRIDAGIDHGLRAHASAKRQYSPEEVFRMMEAVRKGSFLDRDSILKAWQPFSDSKSPA